MSSLAPRIGFAGGWRSGFNPVVAMFVRREMGDKTYPGSGGSNLTPTSRAWCPLSMTQRQDGINFVIRQVNARNTNLKFSGN